MESSSRRRDLRSSGHHSSSRSSSSSRGSSSSSRYDTRLDRGRSSSRGDRERTSQKQHSSSQQSARQQSTLNVRDVSYINEAHVVTIRRLFNHLGPIIDHLNLISGRLSLLGKRQFIGLNKERFDFLSAFLSTKAAPSHIAQLYRELVRTEQTQPDQSVQQLGLFSDNRSIIAQNFKRIHWWLERCDWQARLDTQFANLYKVRTTIAWQCKCNAKKSAVQHVIDIFPYQDCSLQDLLGGSKSHCPKCGVNINHYFTFGSAPQFILLTVNNGGHCTITMDESVEITIRENDDGVEGLRAEVKYLVDCVVYYDHNDRVYNLATRHNNEWVKRNNRGNVAPIHDSRFSQFVNIVVLRRIGPVDSNTSFRSSSNSSLYDHVKAQLQPRDCASDIVAASTSVSVGSSEVDASAAIDSGLLNIDSGVPPLHYISHPSPGSHSALPLHPYLDTHVSSAGNGNSTACDHIAAVPSSSPVLLFGDTPALESANSGKLVINASEQSHQHSPTATATERPQVVSFSEYIARRSRLALIMKDTVSQQQLSIGSETATYTDVGSRSNNVGDLPLSSASQQQPSAENSTDIDCSTNKQTQSSTYPQHSTVVASRATHRTSVLSDPQPAQARKRKSNSSSKSSIVVSVNISRPHSSSTRLSTGNSSAALSADVHVSLLNVDEAIRCRLCVQKDVSEMSQYLAAASSQLSAKVHYDPVLDTQSPLPRVFLTAAKEAVARVIQPRQPQQQRARRSLLQLLSNCTSSTPIPTTNLMQEGTIHDIHCATFKACHVNLRMFMGPKFIKHIDAIFNQYDVMLITEHHPVTHAAIEEYIKNHPDQFIFRPHGKVAALASKHRVKILSNIRLDRMSFFETIDFHRFYDYYTRFAVFEAMMECGTPVHLIVSYYHSGWLEKMDKREDLGKYIDHCLSKLELHPNVVAMGDVNSSCHFTERVRYHALVKTPVNLRGSSEYVALEAMMKKEGYHHIKSVLAPFGRHQLFDPVQLTRAMTGRPGGLRFSYFNDSLNPVSALEPVFLPIPLINRAILHVGVNGGLHDYLDHGITGIAVNLLPINTGSPALPLPSLPITSSYYKIADIPCEPFVIHIEPQYHDITVSFQFTVDNNSLCSAVDKLDPPFHILAEAVFERTGPVHKHPPGKAASALFMVLLKSQHGLAFHTTGPRSIAPGKKRRYTPRPKTKTVKSTRLKRQPINDVDSEHQLLPVRLYSPQQLQQILQMQLLQQRQLTENSRPFLQSDVVESLEQQIAAVPNKLDQL